MSAHEDLSRSHDVKASGNRSFGFVFAAVFSIIAAWPLFFGGGLRWWSLAIAAVFLLLAFVAPGLLAVPNRLWLQLGLLLNRIVSPLALGILFYLVVTPTGMLMRALGKDNLRLRTPDADGSYWIKRDPPGPKPDSLNHQF